VLIQQILSDPAEQTLLSRFAELLLRTSESLANTILLSKYGGVSPLKAWLATNERFSLANSLGLNFTNINWKAPQRSDSQEFDESHFLNAISLLACASLAYETKLIVSEQLHLWGFNRDSILHFSLTNHFGGFVAEATDFAIVCFRGDEPLNVEDWIDDTLSTAVNIVTGTKEGIPRNKKKLPVSGNVKANLRDANLLFEGCQAGQYVHSAIIPANKQIFITGHGKGAALAQVFAASLLNMECKDLIAGVYTAGQPAVGDERFVKSVDRLLLGRDFTFVNHQDLVPITPKSGITPPTVMGPGHGVYIQENGTLLPEDETLQSQIWSRWDWLPRTVGHPFQSLFEVYQHGLRDAVIGTLFPAAVTAHLPFQYFRRIYEIAVRKGLVEPIVEPVVGENFSSVIQEEAVQ